MVNDVPTAKKFLMLLQRVFRGNKHRDYLIECIEFNGYIREVEQPLLTEEEVNLDLFKSESSSSDEEAMDFLPESRPFASRTFITPSETQKRLNILQQRGITSEEQDYNEIKEQIILALNQVKAIGLDYDRVLNTAMNFYLEIKKVYTNTNLIKGEIKGSVRRGYVLLILYYSLLEYKVCISKEQLVSYFDNKIRLSDLAKADKNIQMIFGDKLGKKCLSLNLSLSDTAKVETLIKQMIKLGKFNDPVTSVQNAAAVYYITKMKYSLLEQLTGITADTIRKTVRIITNSLN